MSRSVYLHDHYSSYGVPDEIAENLKEFFPDDDGLSYEEVLLQQASMYQSFQERDKKKVNDEGEGGSSKRVGGMSQEAIDEALARSLQELEEEFDDILISENSNGSTSGSTESSITTPLRAQAASSDSGQDSIDLDNMQYEELVNLGEAIGVENRGISAARISQLPTSKYRSGLFSMMKKKEENCVICQMNYNSGERLITLPCSHQYHMICITDWLKLKKVSVNLQRLPVIYIDLAILPVRS
ncbi:hypothetical protein OSB04_025665 [Centaurea solstitialis]|uniref:RING-type domain-containing protein n=1 Tax=Centaurea solstitialis TaxID=347529 RepID=A0AA38SW24_9ASTR|nr:hypothetical protein OSB04_025665 [Centaurea solstitialis]